MRFLIFVYISLGNFCFLLVANYDQFAYFSVIFFNLA